jgi:hypothetical protein
LPFFSWDFVDYRPTDTIRGVARVGRGSGEPSPDRRFKGGRGINILYGKFHPGKGHDGPERE